MNILDDLVCRRPNTFKNLETEKENSLVFLSSHQLNKNYILQGIFRYN